MQSMAKSSLPIDLVTLLEELERQDATEIAGGTAYISQLADGLPRVTNIGHYAAIIKKKANLRSLAKACDVAARKALEPGTDPEEITTTLETLCAQYRKSDSAERNLQFKTGADMGRLAPQEVQWIARPWVAVGSITEIDGKVKSAGKSTWVTHLVDAVIEGNPFMGQPATKSPVVYLSEQPSASFEQSMGRARLIGHDDFIYLLWNDTIGTPWPEIVSAAVAECMRRDAKLLVIDTLAQFACLAGDSENNSGDALAAMQPLQQAAAKGIGVIVVRHERKSGGAVGDSGRGSSAYAGAVDIVLSLRRPDGKSRPTIRIMQALSRFSETPSEMVIELTPDGYVSLGTEYDLALQEAIKAILSATSDGIPGGYQLHELLDVSGVKRTTAQRAIQQLLSEGRLVRFGNGRRGNPFKFAQEANVSAQGSSVKGHQETETTVTEEG